MSSRSSQIAIAVVLATWSLGAGQAVAQPMEVQEGGRPELSLREAMRGLAALTTPIDSAKISPSELDKLGR